MPDQNDVLSLLDGALVLLAILVVALVNGTIISAALALAMRLCSTGRGDGSTISPRH